MADLDALKAELLRPMVELMPLLKFRGHQNAARYHALWNFAQAMYLDECGTMNEGTKLFRTNGELGHFCGLHNKELPLMTLWSFFSRLALSPKVTGLVTGFADWVNALCPYPFQLTRLLVRLAEPRKLRPWKPTGVKSTDIAYLFGPQSPERTMLETVHAALPRYVNHAIRNDLCQDLLCDIIAGDIKMENLKDEVASRLRKAKAFLPHSEDDFFRFGLRADGIRKEEWKEWYRPPEPTFEEKVETLHEHWQCGVDPPPVPADILSPMSVEAPAETFHQMQQRHKKRREVELLGESYIEKREHVCRRKIRYDTEDLAGAAVAQIAKRYGATQYVYACPYCTGWHRSKSIGEQGGKGIMHASPDGRVENIWITRRSET